MRKFENAARQNKTSKANRTTYIYYTSDGAEITLTPAEVGDEWIAYLHNEDDNAVNAERREQYHVQLRINEEDYSLQRNRNSSVPREMRANQQVNSKNKKMAIPHIADNAFAGKAYMTTPEEQLLQVLRSQEKADEILAVREAIKTLQPQQQALIQKVFYDKRTNVDIAAEENVTEAAIRNRLKKIYANLAKKLKN